MEQREPIGVGASNTEDPTAVERRARLANSRDLWDGIWAREGEDSWRQHALERVYARVRKLLPKGSRPNYVGVVDVGGGAGLLARQLIDAGISTLVWDHSDAAVALCRDAGIPAEVVDVEDLHWRRHIPDSEYGTFGWHRWMVATEVLEHLSDRSRRSLLEFASTHSPEAGAIFSVPNNRLGPDEEPQHTIKWTALEFLTLLREYWGRRCRVEVMGPYLLGVCGDIADKPYTMSVCFPARDEAADIEATLASFRGVADEMVVGVDYRTVDNTVEIAKRYAEKVFIIDDPKGETLTPDAYGSPTCLVCDQPMGTTPDCSGCDAHRHAETVKARENRPAPSVHFAHIRNLCIQQCTGDWIFMTEAHERLGKGVDILLNLGKAFEDAGVSPEATKVGVVRRTAHNRRDSWWFEWLFRNDYPTIRFTRATHNFLLYPRGYMQVLLPGIETLHDRVHERDVARQKQRKVQNRLSLMEDWLETGSEGSLMYLGFEWRDYDAERCTQYLQDVVRISKRGSTRYMARMVLAKTLLTTRCPERPEFLLTRPTTPEERAEANRIRTELRAIQDILFAATADDWSRTEHWIYLGDIEYELGNYEKAKQFYQYGSVRIGNPPMTQWWYDAPFYAELPAQRLAMACGQLGHLDEGLAWAENAVDLLPDDAGDVVFAEARENVRLFKEAIAQRAARRDNEGDVDGSA